MTEKPDLSDEAVTLAARILAAGNPFDNEQVHLALREELHRQGVTGPIYRIVKAAGILLRPYMDNALSLAGHVLGRESEEEAAPKLSDLDPSMLGKTAPSLMPILPPGEEIRIHSIETREGVLGLLKGIHPTGSTWAHLAIALDIRGSDLTPIAHELRKTGAVRMEDAAVFASLETMADKSITALPWPEREIG